jgi:hypothetical protein
MALDARHRSSIYGKLVPVLGEEDANALMTEFPSVEADELVTKQFLRAELAELRGEMAELRADMTGEFGAVRGEIAGLRGDMTGEFGAVRSEIADLRNEVTLRMIAVVGTATAVLGTLNALS